MATPDIVHAAQRPLTALGMMSGTSLDGIDAAILTTDGERTVKTGPAATFPYPSAFRERLRSLLGRDPGAEADPVVAELTTLHGDAVERLLHDANLLPADIDVIGFHGHTVLHEPQRHKTIQIGDAQRLADRTAIPVVSDFRSADMRGGGQGAPLVPVYHRTLCHDLTKPVAVLNIGGVANITWIGPIGRGVIEESLIAFDCGPGNALIDDWLAVRRGKSFDAGGRVAAAGRIEQSLLATWLDHPFFDAPPPKSLDRNTFRHVLDHVVGLSVEDGAATLAAFTVAAVARVVGHVPEPPTRWLVCGGGRHNAYLMQLLGQVLMAPVQDVDALGWRGDWLEAEAFAFLAVRSLRGLPLTVPTTTGVRQPLSGGVVHMPGGAIATSVRGRDSTSCAVTSRPFRPDQDSRR
jgi:anhydro-N-acetylmuramic acid kinase